MTGRFQCPCCGGAYAVAADDVGKSIVCPNSRQLVAVTADAVTFPTAARPRRPGWVVPAVAVLLLLGLASGVGVYVSRDKKPADGVTDNTAGRREVAKLTNDPAEKTTTPAVGTGTPADAGSTGTPDTGGPAGSTTTPPPVTTPPVTTPPVTTPPVTTPPVTGDAGKDGTGKDGSGKDGSAGKAADKAADKAAADRAAADRAAADRAAADRAAADKAAADRAAADRAAADKAAADKAAADKAAADKAAADKAAAAKAAVKEIDARGFVVHSLLKRIDTRSEDDLLKDLLGVREVALDQEPQRLSSTALFQYATAARNTGGLYAGTLILAKGRPDLASLPFRVGTDAATGRDASAALSALSKQLRTTIQSCIPNLDDPRPDPDKLFVSLMADKGGDFRGGKWQSPEAVPCIQQMLQAEGHDVRRMSVELLAGIGDKASTAALAQWAVYDTNAANRAAAVNALRGRDPAQVAKLLLDMVRFPWPRAAEHAAEALVALDMKETVPTLAGFLALPDPDAAFDADFRGEAGKFRREMVRTNHARNCVMCHRPSFDRGDLVRAAIPDPTKPIAPPTTPSYYESGQFFVSADTTYLRQDFSAVQPVPAPGPWPTHQRFDYLVSVRPAIAGDPVDSVTSDYKAAVRFALKELTGADRGPDWAGDRAADVSADPITGRAAQWLFGKFDSKAYLRLKLQEFGKPLLALTDAERNVLISLLRRYAGGASTRYAMIAYLDPLTRTGPAADRELAAKLLADFRTGPDAGRPFTKSEFDEILKLFRHANPAVRAAAVAAAGDDPDVLKGVWEDILRLLREDPEGDVRRESAAALAKLTSPHALVVEGFARALSDSFLDVRVVVSGALGRFKFVPREAGRHLAAGLVGKWAWDTEEQKQAFLAAVLKALVALGDKADGAYGPLTKAAAGSDPTDATDAMLAKAIKALPPPPKADIPGLVAAMAKPGLKTAAADQIMAAGEAGVKPLIDALGPDNTAATRLAAAELLGKAASLSRPAGLSPSQQTWRDAIDALAAAKTADRADEVKKAAAASLDKLTKAGR